MKNISTLILRNSLLLFATIFAFSSVQLTAQTKTVAPRIVQAINEAKLVPMHSKVHPLARPEFDRGVVADSQPMNRMLLLLQRSPEQETALRSLMDEQQTRNSPNYHAWLTPAQFGQQFGVADADVQKVTDWLTQKGFTGIKVGPGHMFVEFSGTAGLVRNAFHTEIHNFTVNGEAHMANVSVPQVPAALAPVVAGIHSLHNFRKKSFLHYSQALAQAKAEGKLKPGFGTGTGLYAMGPVDFATIYNILPSTLDGTGQSIAIVARSNINVQDIIDFRTGFGLPNPTTSFTAANNIIVTGPDPGIISGDDGEATLDVEWSGAVAPKAAIKLVVSDGTATTFADGVDLSAFYIVEYNVAPIMSESFGLCEAFSSDGFENAIWEQAAAQGITVMVSAGDNGSAGCDPDTDPNASVHGLAVNGAASTPFNVAVGGTDFDDAANPTIYWNNTAALTTAKSYIPEITWNASCASAAAIGNVTGFCATVNQQGLDLLAGSGGASNCGIQDVNFNCVSGYPKPSWQTGAGVPADGVRDIPDVSLFAAVNTASNNFYILCLADSGLQNGQPCNLTGPNYNFTGVGGTSAASPAFAGIIALVNQSEVTGGRLKAGEGQGNVDYILYKLAANQATSPGNAACNSNGTNPPASTCTFNDVTKGNNSVACDGGVGAVGCGAVTAGTTGILLEAPVPPYTANAPGWSATTGYDLATGLGSVNVSNLVTNWANVTTNFKASTTTITAPAPGSVTITHGANVSFSTTVAPTSGTGTPTGDVSLIAQPVGAPQFGLNDGTLAAGKATIQTLQLPGGTYPVVVHYAGDATFAPSDSAGFNVTVSKENSSATTTIYEYWTSTPTVVTSAPYGSLYLFRVDVIGTQNQDTQQCATATVAIPCPTGTVTFTADGAPLNDFLNTASGTSTNSATLNVLGFAEDRVLGSTGLPGGSHSIGASYSGDSSYNASNAPAAAITITSAGTITAVTANGTSTANVVTGQTVTLVARVNGFNQLSGLTNAVASNGAGPTGSVTFSTCGTATSCKVTVVPTAFTNSNAGAFATATLTTAFAATGTQTISATFTTGDTNYAGSASSGTSNATVNVGAAPAKLAFTVQPSNVVATVSIAPAVQVTVEDASGNIVPSATNPVTIAIGTNPSGGTLSGTLTQNAVNGIATFANLSINNTGTGYTLAASATGLTGATSTAFNVTASTGSFAVSYSPSPLPLSSATGAAAAATVKVTPSGGFTGTVAVTASTLPPGVTCTPSPLNISVTGVTAVNGTLNCQVAQTSSSLTASNFSPNFAQDGMLEAKTTPATAGGKGWWTLSAGTGFAAIFLLFLPGRKRFRAALGLGLVCILSFTLGCSGNGYGGGGGGGGLTATVTKLTVPSAKVASGTAFTFSVAVTGGTPAGQVQLFDGATMIGTAATVSGGMAAPTAPALSVGTHSISAHYLGDAYTKASASGTLNMTVTGTTTIVITTTPPATPAAAALSVTIS